MFQFIKSKKCIIFYYVFCWNKYSKWAEVSRNPRSQIQSYCICFVLGCSILSSDVCPGSREFGMPAQSPRLNQWSLWLLAFRCNRGFCKIWILNLFRGIDTKLLLMLSCMLGECCNKWEQSYSPGHECSSLKRLLCWNKSWQMRWYSNHLCWGCQECHWGHC